MNVFSFVVELIWPLLIESIRFATLALTLIGCGKNSTDTVNTKGDSKESLSEEVNKEDNSKNKNDIAFKENETGQRIEEQRISFIYPLNWVKKTVQGQSTYFLDEKGTNVNLVVESMNGLSEEDYNKASDIDVKTNLGVNSIAVREQEFNNKKARVTYFVQKSQWTDIPTYQVTFLNNGKSYIFTISAVKNISDENMKSFENMLNTVEFQR
nr:cell wall-binding protein [Clostridium beijerinckii]